MEGWAIVRRTLTVRSKRLQGLYIGRYLGTLTLNQHFVIQVHRQYTATPIPRAYQAIS